MSTYNSGGLVMILLVIYSAVKADFNYHQYCIIGAGPSGKLFRSCRFSCNCLLLPVGLQMGYFLHTAGRDYLIIEKNNVSGSSTQLLIVCIINNLNVFFEGSFFLHYPRHRRLISINKRYTGV